ncbi:Feruloyl CoA ortho-hydroxylase 1 [Forsythia ovata]|uniref:Feruloyl CoA ortho-hydroxylase 1 n=1 Tax=Forsythia ovata TaxID=205694 RepID=A0ABD1X5A2_9LAMI
MAPALSTIQSNSWDLKHFVVDEGHGVKGLSDIGIQTLPKQYIQPPQEQITTSTILTEESIPVIDMSNSNDQMVADMICNAAEKWGFFQIINHGIPIQVFDNVKNATHRFYGLPAEEKKKYSKEESSTNNVRYGTSFSPQAEKALEWKDWLSLFYVSDEEAGAFWPSICRDEALEYMNKSEHVIKKLLEILMKRLNVTSIDETKESLLMGSTRINLNYYPKCPNPDLTIGTLIFGSTVPPIDGSLVINVGDALQILSNGRYKSIEHRVIANGNNNRVSVPIFVNPKPSDVIGPLPEVLQNGEKPIYKQLLYSEYVRHFFKKPHDGKETVDFAKVQ